MTNYSADYMVKAGLCQFCNTRVSARLHLRITCSGSETFCWVCVGCDRMNPFKGMMWINSDVIYSHLTRTQLNALPVLMESPTDRCARCGKRGTERHHWAPKAIFDDADKWPQDYLCKPCHDLWHSKMKVT